MTSAILIVLAVAGAVIVFMAVGIWTVRRKPLRVEVTPACRPSIAPASPDALERFIRSANIRHYRDLLDRAPNEAEGRRILMLLQEEQRRQIEAGDPVT